MRIYLRGHHSIQSHLLRAGIVLLLFILFPFKTKAFQSCQDIFVNLESSKSFKPLSRDEFVQVIPQAALPNAKAIFMMLSVHSKIDYEQVKEDALQYLTLVALESYSKYLGLPPHYQSNRAFVAKMLINKTIDFIRSEEGFDRAEYDQLKEIDQEQKFVDASSNKEEARTVIQKVTKVRDKNKNLTKPIYVDHEITEHLYAVDSMRAEFSASISENARTHQDYLDQLKTHLDDLPRNHRQMVELYLFEGQSRHEISRRLGLTHARVSQILGLGIRILFARTTGQTLNVSPLRFRNMIWEHRVYIDESMDLQALDRLELPDNLRTRQQIRDFLYELNSDGRDYTEKVVEFRQILKSVSANYRSVFMSFYFENKGYKQISEETGQPETTLRHQITATTNMIVDSMVWKRGFYRELIVKKRPVEQVSVKYGISLEEAHQIHRYLLSFGGNFPLAITHDFKPNEIRSRRVSVLRRAKYYHPIFLREITTDQAFLKSFKSSVRDHIGPSSIDLATQLQKLESRDLYLFYYFFYKVENFDILSERTRYAKSVIRRDLQRILADVVETPVRVTMIDFQRSLSKPFLEPKGELSVESLSRQRLRVFLFSLGIQLDLKAIYAFKRHISELDDQKRELLILFIEYSWDMHKIAAHFGLNHMTAVLWLRQTVESFYTEATQKKKQFKPYKLLEAFNLNLVRYHRRIIEDDHLLPYLGKVETQDMILEKQTKSLWLTTLTNHSRGRPIWTEYFYRIIAPEKINQYYRLLFYKKLHEFSALELEVVHLYYFEGFESRYIASILNISLKRVRAVLGIKMYEAFLEMDPSLAERFTQGRLGFLTQFIRKDIENKRPELFSWRNEQ